jgi:membrane protein DedA with SNARE-associated domain
MITDIIFAVTTWITHVISSMGYTGVALLMAIESAAIPLPSEIIMPFAGFLVESGRFSLWGLALAGAIGSTVGSYATYYLGFYGGRKLIQKYGHWIHISETELAWTEKFFERLGPLSTFVGRILPVFRTFISIPAGIAKVPLIPFLIYAFVGSFIWSYFLAWLGFRLGEHWHDLENYFRKFDIAIGVLIVGVLVWWIYVHFWKAKKG